MHRLRQYTLYYTIEFFARHDPLKYLANKPALLGRISKWQVLLSEFNISYVNQSSRKGRVLADQLAESLAPEKSQALFLVENTVLHGEDSEVPFASKWKMYFDGAANIHGCGIGAVLVSPEGDQFPASARLEFPYTNNIAEYEAYIMGLNLAIDMGIGELEAYGDSSLIIF